jgi:hypothetical protein
VEVKGRKQIAERAAEEKRRITTGREIEQTAQRTAAFREWHACRHRGKSYSVR